MGVFMMIRHAICSDEPMSPWVKLRSKMPSKKILKQTEKRLWKIAFSWGLNFDILRFFTPWDPKFKKSVSWSVNSLCKKSSSNTKQKPTIRFQHANEQINWISHNHNLLAVYFMYVGVTQLHETTHWRASLGWVVFLSPWHCGCWIIHHCKSCVMLEQFTSNYNSFVCDPCYLWCLSALNTKLKLIACWR